MKIKIGEKYRLNCSKVSPEEQSIALRGCYKDIVTIGSTAIGIARIKESGWWLYTNNLVPLNRVLKYNRE